MMLVLLMIFGLLLTFACLAVLVYFIILQQKDSDEY